MRLFRSPWTYLAWLALCLNSIWHELQPHAHPATTPWHPEFNAIVLILANALCICVMFSFVRLTSNALEKVSLALFAVAFSFSALIDLLTLGHFRTPLPSFRLVFLTINTLLALLTATRFAQVLREPPTPGILSRMQTLSE